MAQLWGGPQRGVKSSTESSSCSVLSTPCLPEAGSSEQAAQYNCAISAAVSKGIGIKPIFVSRSDGGG